MNNGFVEPGAYVCPFGSSIGSNCFETPFSFSGHKAAYTIGPFVGYRVQWGNWVVGIEGDWSYKNSETSLSQSSTAAIAVTGSNYAANRPVLRLRQAEIGFLDPGARGHARHALEPAIRDGWRRVRRNQRLVRVFRKPLLLPGQPPRDRRLRASTSTTVATATTAVTWSDTRVGSTVGAGWETEIAPRWKVRGEYRYTDFGSYTKTFGLTTRCTGSSAAASSCTGTPSSSVSIDLKESFHTFRVGLAFDL